MAYHKVDPHSGALVFHLTQDEKEVRTLKEELQALKAELTEAIQTVKETKE